MQQFESKNTQHIISTELQCTTLALENCFDIGVNLTNTQFANDYELQIKQANAAGVSHLCITGTSEQESILAANMAQQYEQVYATAGVHPHDAKDVSDNYLNVLKDLYQNNASVRAIGECGLDFNRNYSPQEIQIKVFNEQLQLASELNAPLFLHQRDAHQAFLNQLKAQRNQLKQIVVHCFTGSQAELEDYLELDCYIGITGWICDERRGQDVLKLVSQIPNDRLLIETDAPFLIPRNLKPKPKSRKNLPCYLPHIAEQIAKQKQLDVATVARQTFYNSLAFFNLTQGTI